ncbi:MAG: ribosome small subunit-dependent GTPase A [Gammaproteobacteria bacterium]
MAELLEGLVIAHLGQGLAVEVADTLYLCQTKRKLDTCAVGDKVLLEIAAPGQGRVAEILPRRTLLARPAANGKIRPVAANIDQVLVVFASEPPADWLLVDQYLAVCENRGLEAVLVVNKTDLPGSDALQDELHVYRQLGYPLLPVSTVTGSGMDALKRVLHRRSSIFAGQSGVGKSSLTNLLLPEKQLRINTLSAGSGHGRHTTTAATLYHLPEGGAIIDSPGVAIFGLAGLREADLAHGFREFQPFIGTCLFNDCRHVQDKGCAVRAAVEQGSVSAQRYRRFLKLREKMPLRERA